MPKYRLYLEGVTHIAERFEADGTVIGAEQILKNVCYELRDLSDCIFYLEDLAGTFCIDYADFKIIEMDNNLSHVRFIDYGESLMILEKLK